MTNRQYSCQQFLFPKWKKTIRFYSFLWNRKKLISCHLFPNGKKHQILFIFLWNSKKIRKIYKWKGQKFQNACMIYWRTRQLSFVSKWKKILFIFLKFFRKKKNVYNQIQKRKKFTNACVIYCNFVLKVNLNDSSLTCICLSHRICSLYWDSKADEYHTTIV